MIRTILYQCSVFIMLLSFCATGCKKLGSVVDLYKFPSDPTLDLALNISVDYKIDAGGGPAVQITNQNFVLRGYVIDQGQETQIAVGRAGGADPVFDLPVVLETTTLSFDAVVQIPVRIQPEESGYVFRFELIPTTTVLSLLDPDVTTEADLEALKGGVQPGTGASQNKVKMSLATTLAYKILSNSGLKGYTATQLTAFDSILSAVEEILEATELSLDTSKTPSLESYSSAVLAGVKLKLITSKAIQKVIAEALEPAAVAAGLGDLAKTLTDTLKTFVEDVKTLLSDENSTVSQLFQAESIDRASIPDPDTFTNVVYAPLALAFTDTDSGLTLGGGITITAPVLKTGISAYALYFGAEVLGEGKLQKIGEVDAKREPLVYDLPAGTEQPTQATRYWVFPIVSGTELKLGTSLVIVNVGGANPAPNKPNAPSVAASNGKNIISWTSSESTTYDLYWSTSSPVSLSDNRIPNVTSPYTHKGLSNGVTYYYALTAKQNNRSSNLSDEASGKPGSSAGPSKPASLTAAGGFQRARVSWTSGGTDTVGFVLVRKAGSASSWTPTSGTTYANSTVLDAETGEKIVYVGTGLSLEDTGLQAGTYHYSLFAYTSDKTYSEVLSAPANVYSAVNLTWVAGANTNPSGRSTSDPKSPGVRYNSISCGRNGIVYLFGGNYQGSLLGDFWKFSDESWTLLSGDATNRKSGTYGTKGQASASNSPGSRESGGCWVDNAGNVWLFGGRGMDDGTTVSPAVLNDLWKWDGTAWTWVKGEKVASSANVAVKGTTGVAAANNTPAGSRQFGVTADHQGNGWVFVKDQFGGYDSGLWKFDGQNWTLMKDYSSATAIAGVYGTKGVASSSNRPGRRLYPAMAAGPDGSIYMYGGGGVDGNNNTSAYELNDLWKFDGTDWIWLAGPSDLSAGGLSGTAPVYGTKGTAAAANTPGGRSASALWVDKAGTVWLFGGYNFRNGNFYNDLFSFSQDQWTWQKGSDSVNQPGSFGTKGQADANNIPGARRVLANWLDSEGGLRLFGSEPLELTLQFCLLVCDNSLETAGLHDIWRIAP